MEEEGLLFCVRQGVASLPADGERELADAFLAGEADADCRESGALAASPAPRRTWPELAPRGTPEETLRGSAEEDAAAEDSRAEKSAPLPEKLLALVAVVHSARADCASTRSSSQGCSNRAGEKAAAAGGGGAEQEEADEERRGGGAVSSLDLSSCATPKAPPAPAPAVPVPRCASAAELRIEKEESVWEEIA